MGERKSAERSRADQPAETLLDEGGEGLVQGMGAAGEESSFHDGSQAWLSEREVNIGRG